MRTPASQSPARPFHHGNLRQALLEAALLATDIEGVSLRQLAGTIGVTAAAAYRHFASREDLLFEVAGIGFDRLTVYFQRALPLDTVARDGKEARQRFCRLGAAYLRFADEQPALWRLMFGAQAEAYRSRPTQPDERSSYDYLPAALLGLHQTGVIPAPPSEQDALFAWSAIHGVATLRSGRVPGALDPTEDLAAAVAARVIKALQ